MLDFSSFDEWVIRLTGQIAGRYGLLDKFIVKFTDLHTVKLVPLMAILAGLLYSENKRARTTVILAVISMFAAVGVGRLIQDFSPMRLRPLHSGNPEFVFPIGTDLKTLEHWSSFPSDHAALVFALSTTVWLYSRRLGILFYVWSVLFVCLPRIYSGYHYASDVIAGALVGIIVAFCAERLAPAGKLTEKVERLSYRNSSFLAAVAFVILFEFATMFDDIRMTGAYLLRLGKNGGSQIGASQPDITRLTSPSPRG
jgi:membrane-associated phospholipid phosphatase